MANAVVIPGVMAPGPPQTIDALPITVNLLLYAGDDFYLDLTVTNPDGSDADLEGAAARAQIRRKAGDPDEWAAFDAELEGNVIRLHLSASASRGLSGKGVWDCQLHNGETVTLAAGRVSFTAAVSQP